MQLLTGIAQRLYIEQQVIACMSGLTLDSSHTSANSLFHPADEQNLRDYCDALKSNLVRVPLANNIQLAGAFRVSEDLLFDVLDEVITHDFTTFTYDDVALGLVAWIYHDLQYPLDYCMSKLAPTPPHHLPSIQKYYQPGLAPSSTAGVQTDDELYEILEDVAKAAKQGLDRNPIEFCQTPAVKKLQEIQDLLEKKGIRI